MRSVLQRTRRVGQESGEDVEQLELTFSFDEIKSVFEFADGFPIEDEFFSQTQGKQPETSALSHPMPHSQHPIEILRFNTCGSVDDGKSAVIGRLVTNYCAVFACRVSEECQSRASHPLSLGERVGVRGNRPSDVFAVRNRL